MDWIEEQLSEIRAQGLWREPMMVSTSPGRLIRREGMDLINFASNNYLDLADQVSTSMALSGSGGSRLICGSHEQWMLLETELAAFHRTEASLAFSSGYAANVGLLQSFGSNDTHIFSDALNHASIIDGARLAKSELSVFDHNNISALEGFLARSSAELKLVVCESIYSMDGDFAPLREIRQVCDRYGALMIVDEAHGGGWLGGGRGLCFELGVQPDIHVGTLSKAYGWVGGFVCASKKVIELVRHRARSFVYSTAPPAMVGEGARDALRLVVAAEEERTALQENIAFARKTLGLDSSSPVFSFPCSDPVLVASTLADLGLWAHPIRWPTVPRGTERLRISLMSSHTTEDIQQLATALRRFR